MKPRTAPLASALLVLASTFIGCGQDAPAPEPVIRPVRYQQAFSGAAQRTRSFSGTARASVESALSFKVAGTVRRLEVKTGDKVQGGQLLTELDPKDYELQVQQTAASHDQALAQQRNAAANYRRTLALYENNNASRNDLDAARAGKESADAQVRSFENSLELARLQLSYTRLTAPVAGDVAEVTIEIGENVRANETVIRLSAGAQPEVVVGIPEVFIAQIREGDAVSVTFTALGDRRLPATVTEVGVERSSASSTFEVRAKLETADAAVRSGMACEVTFEFEANRGSDHFVVPAIAVSEDRDGRFVYVVELTEDELGLTRRRNVEVGDLRTDGIEIVSGLQEGELVVIAGVSKITGGQTVKLQAP